MNKPQTDDNDCEIQAGDLLKVFHFTAAIRRRKIYMHKLVVHLRDLDPRADNKAGDSLYTIGACELFPVPGGLRFGRCPLSAISSCEIIDGQDCWWERPREKS